MFEQVVYVEGHEADKLIDEFRETNLESVVDSYSILYEPGTHPTVENLSDISAGARQYNYQRWVLVVSTTFRYAVLYYRTEDL